MDNLLSRNEFRRLGETGYTITFYGGQTYTIVDVYP